MPLIGELAALSASVLWAFTTIVFTEATIKLGAFKLNLDRLILATILILITLLVTGISFNITYEQLIYLSISGVIGLILGDSFLFAAFKTIGPRIGMLIMSFNPAIAAVVAYFALNESISLPAIIGMLLTLCGISIVVLEKPKVSDKFKVSVKGVIYGFLAAFGQGIGLIFSKMAFLEGESINTFTATFYRISIAALFMVILSLLKKQNRNPIKPYIVEKRLIKLLIIGSIIGPYLGITLSFIAVTKTQIGIASTLLSITPLIMLPISKFVYKEKLSYISILGAFLAVGGVSLLFML